MKFILGKKIEMSQIFDEQNNVVPITILQAGPCVVIQVKNQEKDKYEAIQIGFQEKKKINKPITGHLKNLGNFKYIKEFRDKEKKIMKNEKDEYKIGDKIDVSTFKVGDIIKASAISKGKGFQGVVKRHGFHGSPATHGHKDQLRMPGSIGSTEPARVFKGTRMGGHMGNRRVTTKNLKVVLIDLEKNLLILKGAVPGARNGLVEIVSL
ncbi:50S ribosomal protein L3 [Candidatus Kuenenbacteria bacterium HGW-Kuenenbacteria-1]|uniref:Large ribosomal subunit protein uL3 n=1 Tax=Candidatus Kuenenbacteria bacterium HGW-Kuenenbacteria-1 TaxID=2013812 RepID=A0A2N1UNG5_9BACT|nr:MAG: 50S ribosomal protein L3 [Candidatus Kuenenbacteria bacterium HGW-Kuenenbacteria-1]